jgi:hypothetical protein
VQARTQQPAAENWLGPLLLVVAHDLNVAAQARMTQVTPLEA